MHLERTYRKISITEVFELSTFDNCIWRNRLVKKKKIKTIKWKNLKIMKFPTSNFSNHRGSFAASLSRHFPTHEWNEKVKVENYFQLFHSQLRLKLTLTFYLKYTRSLSLKFFWKRTLSNRKKKRSRYL